jgi:NAD(P)-dependent dehydrogenase (short-subunit alcohol dehydrogenase family)
MSRRPSTGQHIQLCRHRALSFVKVRQANGIPYFFFLFFFSFMAIQYYVQALMSTYLLTPFVNPLDGRVVLVTGGGTNIGFSIARAFVRAGAKTVIIVGRREDVLLDAKSRLEEEAAKSVILGGKNKNKNNSNNKTTSIVSWSVDVTDAAQTNNFWNELASRGIAVDVFVANVAKATQEKPILELGADEVWSQVEVNAKAPLYWIEKFNQQASDRQKVCLGFFFFFSCFLRDILQEGR